MPQLMARAMAPLVASVVVFALLTTATTFGSVADLPDNRHSRFGKFLDWAGHQAVNVEKSSYVRVDRRGVPIGRYLQRDGTYKWARNPTTIASHGLWAWSRYVRSHNPNYRALAFRVGKWMLNHQDKNGTWHNNFSYQWNHSWTAPGWTDGLAQGLGIALFNRLSYASDKRIYLRRARLALKAFGTPIVSGGILSYYEGQPFFEHVPQDDAFILNGHVLTTLALRDLAPQSDRARDLYRIGLETIIPMLPLYDVGPGQAAYDLTHRTNRIGEAPTVVGYYTDIVSRALYELNRRHPNATLRHYADRWAIAL